MTCPHCHEPILDGEDTRRMPHLGADGATTMRTYHRECLTRIIVGSVGHQLQRCSCYGGADEDPPGATPREAARAALAVRMLRRVRIEVP